MYRQDWVKKLDIAERSAGEYEQEIRDRLTGLYGVIREERRHEIENRLELMKQKWDLKKELREVDADELYGKQIIEFEYGEKGLKPKCDPY